MTEEEIFIAAADKPPEQRAAFLDAACGGDAVLRAGVEALLASDAEAGDFLLRPPVGVTIAAVPGRAAGRTYDIAADVPAEGPGSQIGPYKLLEVIGEGAMGVVFMAEQEHPVRRRVALKLVKPGMDSRQVVARFEAERQALALMDHPNIARVYDAGMTARARPYFVMELVKGVPITQFCDDNHLSPRQRLELFIPVCLAIHHAHQKGIIHRDIKPGNVLVACYDDQPVPKVIDYGVAKAVGPALVEDAAVTAFGGIVGTLQYMSPEQAGFNALDIDTRSDVYALGALLYELLTGSPPLKEQLSRSAAILSMLEAVREAEPPKPSTRVGTASREALPALAARRAVDADTLCRAFRGELDLIVMKALHKDRTQRYDSASGLAKDIGRYLTGEAVEACPPTLRYRVGKLLRRHKGPAVAAAAVVLALLAGVIGTSFGLVRANKARNEETSQRVAADRARDAEARQRAQAELARQAAAANEARALAGEADAKEKARDATIQLAEGLISNGDALVLGRRWLEARQRYLESRELLAGVGRPLLRADVGLADLAAKAPPALLTLRGHAGTVYAVAITPDGRTVLSAGADGTLRFWDLPTGAARRTIKASDGEIYCVTLSPDGKQVLTGGLAGSLRLWDVETGRLVRTFDGLTGIVYAAAFSPDGRSVFAGSSADRQLAMWDAATGERRWAFKEPYKDWTKSLTNIVYGVAVSADGRTAYSVDTDKSLFAWDAATGRPTRTFAGHAGWVYGVALTPDGQSAVTASYDRTLKLWNLATGQATWTFTGHAGYVYCVDVLPDGGEMISGSKDNTLILWDLHGGTSRRALAGHAGPVYAVAVSPDGRVAVSGSEDGSVKVWGLAPPPERRTLAGHVFAVNTVAFSPDGRRALTGGEDKKIKLWDVATGRHLRTLTGHDGAVHRVAFLPDGRSAVSASADKTVRLWDLEAGRAVRTLTGHGKQVNDVVVLPDGRAAVSASDDKTLVLWDLASGQATRTLSGHKAGVVGVALAPDGRTAVSGGADGTMKVWDLSSGMETASFAAHAGAVSSVAFTPDGRHVLSAGADQALKVWDLATGEPSAGLVGHQREVRQSWFMPAGAGSPAVAIFPDGQTAVSAGGDGSLKWWDLKSGRELRQIAGHTSPVKCVAISPDGRGLLTADNDLVPQVVHWDLSLTAGGLALERRASDLTAARPVHGPPAPKPLAAFRTGPPEILQDQEVRLPADDLAALGAWYAHRGKYDWAAEVLEKARATGAKVDPLTLARCYWQLADDLYAAPHVPRDACLPAARREFRRAISGSRDEQERYHLRLCLADIELALFGGPSDAPDPP